MKSQNRRLADLAARKGIRWGSVLSRPPLLVSVTLHASLVTWGILQISGGAGLQHSPPGPVNTELHYTVEAPPELPTPRDEKSPRVTPSANSAPQTPAPTSFLASNAPPEVNEEPFERAPIKKLPSDPRPLPGPFLTHLSSGLKPPRRKADPMSQPVVPMVHTPAPMRPVAAQSTAASPATIPVEVPILAAQPRAGNPTPRYPTRAARRRWAGIAKLSLTIDSVGHVQTVKIIQSSGHDILDDEARRTALLWRFHPATRAGQPIASTRAIEFEFRP